MGWPAERRQAVDHAAGLSASPTVIRRPSGNPYPATRRTMIPSVCSCRVGRPAASASICKARENEIRVRYVTGDPDAAAALRSAARAARRSTRRSARPKAASRTAASAAASWAPDRLNGPRIRFSTSIISPRAVAPADPQPAKPVKLGKRPRHHHICRSPRPALHRRHSLRHIRYRRRRSPECTCAGSSVGQPLQFAVGRASCRWGCRGSSSSTTRVRSVTAPRIASTSTTRSRSGTQTGVAPRPCARGSGTSRTRARCGSSRLPARNRLGVTNCRTSSDPAPQMIRSGSSPRTSPIAARRPAWSVEG